MNPLALPIVAAQAAWVRLTTEVLPPASGPTTGTAGEPSRPRLRIGVVGESTAAGCGVDSHDEGFPGCLARELAARRGRFVEWEVVGQHAATARRLRHRLISRLSDNLDVVVLLSGVNDVLARRAPEEWGADLTAIVDTLAAQAEHVVVAGIPPFKAFPSLPATLARYLARRASRLDEVSRHICAARPRATWIGSTDILPASPDFFAKDRFHPSGSGYRLWAQAVADRLADTSPE